MLLCIVEVIKDVEGFSDYPGSTSRTDRKVDFREPEEDLLPGFGFRLLDLRFVSLKIDGRGLLDKGSCLGASKSALNR